MLRDLLPLALLNMAIIDYIAEPAKKQFPGINFWWLRYVSLISGAGISIASNLNIFPDLNNIVGLILTGILVGGGSKLIYDFLDYTGDSIKKTFG